MTKKRLYVAYGSNLNVRQMQVRCPTAKLVGTGVLENYELQFNGTSKNFHEKLFASLTVGCVKINAVLFPTPSGMAFGCDILVKDKPESSEWVCYDSLAEPFKYNSLNLEQELFKILDKAVQQHGLSYTECNFEKLNGKTVSKI